MSCIQYFLLILLIFLVFYLFCHDYIIHEFIGGRVTNYTFDNEINNQKFSQIIQRFCGCSLNEYLQRIIDMCKTINAYKSSCSSSDYIMDDYDSIYGCRCVNTQKDYFGNMKLEYEIRSFIGDTDYEELAAIIKPSFNIDYRCHMEYFDNKENLIHISTFNAYINGNIDASIDLDEMAFTVHSKTIIQNYGSKYIYAFHGSTLNNNILFPILETGIDKNKLNKLDDGFSGSGLYLGGFAIASTFPCTKEDFSNGVLYCFKCYYDKYIIGLPIFPEEPLLSLLTHNYDSPYTCTKELIYVYNEMNRLLDLMWSNSYKEDCMINKPDTITEQSITDVYFKYIRDMAKLLYKLNVLPYDSDESNKNLVTRRYNAQTYLAFASSKELLREAAESSLDNKSFLAYYGFDKTIVQDTYRNFETYCKTKIHYPADFSDAINSLNWQQEYLNNDYAFIVQYRPYLHLDIEGNYYNSLEDFCEIDQNKFMYEISVSKFEHITPIKVAIVQYAEEF